jgi:hypothetical protein
MEANFRVGQYVLEKPLGEGGMAEVWLGRNVHLGTPAAVKFLSQAYAGVADIEQRFLNEGRRQGSLNHPNIIKVYGFEYVENRSFLILQFIEGESLEDLLRRSGRLQPAEASKIGISVCGALDCAHEHSIVHRDIKPSNILLDENRTPYLGDFGIVLATNEKRVTRTGTAMGTALYMSPEQIKEPSSVDRRSDIYSLGCVLYEMFAGEPPFNPAAGQGDTDFTIKLAHVQQAPPPLRQKNPALTMEIEAVVMRCLAKAPVERYGSCRELKDALSAAMVGRSSGATAQRQTPVPLPAPTPYPGPVVQRAAPVTPVPPMRNTPIPVAPPMVPWVAPPPVYPAPQAQMPAMQYCPNCRRHIATGLFQCPYCSIRLAQGFGAVPAVGPGNLGATASSARRYGILSLVFTAGVDLVASVFTPYDRYRLRTVIGILVITGIVLAILAIVKGNGAKRVLANYPLNPAIRGRATAGIIMGWITVGVVVLSIIVSSQN